MFNPKFDKKCAKHAKKRAFPLQYLHKKIDFLRKLKQSGKTQATFRKNSREYPKTQAK